jgi:TonB family protein
MVLASGPGLLPDDGPLALLRLRRAEADAQLPRSLVLSSLLALTFVVALMVSRALFGWGLAPAGPTERPVRIPTIVDVIDIFTPVPDGAVVVPPIDPTVVNGDIKAVDDSQVGPDGTTFDPSKLTGIVPDQVGTGTSPVGTGTGNGTIPIEGDPDPDVPAFVERFPEVVTKTSPVYPPIARDAGMEGEVIVRMLVATDGRVKRAEIQRSSAMFDEAALAAARQWTFTPALSNGHPVPVWVRVPFRFQLR